MENIDKLRIQVESLIQQSLSEPFDQTKLFSAIEYALTAHGKRIRPILVLLSAQMFTVPIEKVIPLLLAIEYLHNSSLVHDDLPALDNDDYRRGKLTCHKMFGEDIALLAGNAMIAKAFEIVAVNKTLNAEEKVRLIELLSDTFYKICIGQVLDLQRNFVSPDNSVEALELRRKNLEFKHLNKTGALIMACLLGVFLLSDKQADKDAFDKVIFAGRNLGLLFQATDDILDSAVNEETGVSEDEKNGIETYATLFGVEITRQIAQEFADNAKDAFNYFGDTAMPLINLTEYILRRTV